jgi:hypothetical protein
MSPDVVEFLAPVLALLGLGSFVLIGMKLRYNHLRDTKHAPRSEEVERLAESVDLLHDQVRVLRDELDFTERVLTRGRADDDAQGALPEPPAS